MTAEIAVLNRNAIALAADSAVTVNYPGGPKIYNSVNKLFMLSKYAPVGVMVYGVAELTSMPWETIIKSFRRELGETRYPSVERYAEELISFVNGHKRMFGEQPQGQQVLNSVYMQFAAILRDIDELLEEAAQQGPVSDAKVRAVVSKIIRDAHEAWTTAPHLAGVPTNHAARLRRKWSRQIRLVMDTVFQNLPLGRTSRTRLGEIAGLVFTADRFPDSVSGVVVAGYGENEYTPSVVAYDMEGVLLNFVKSRKNDGKSLSVGDAGGAAIIPFAQGEMVSLFMEGIDPRYKTRIALGLGEFADSLTDIFITAVGATGPRERALRKRLHREGAPLLQTVFDQLEAYMHANHVEPVVSAVANLPKEELAAMAETLVSLTSFKRRVTRDPETVGGPIDVAVISKGDGFIWINRKHYFDPSLNPHFAANYFRN